MRRRRILAAALAVVGLAACGAGVDKAQNGPADAGPSDAVLAGDFDVAGQLDPNADNDGDGYVYADDCNDRDPLVNPGAYDVPGDGVDNDCSGGIDDAPTKCDVGLALTSGDALDFAKAIGLCQTTYAAATGKNKRWGVISAALKTTDGVGAPMPKQHGIETAWGAVIRPHEGSAMAVLSTGSARTPGQSDYQKPLDDVHASPPPPPSTSNENAPPPGWPKNSAGCPAPASNTANDSVVLSLTIRVPTNAKAFSYDFDFFTSEYIDYVCSPWNDSYVAILTSKAPLDPSHAGNVSFDALGNPINVNSGFFEVCSPGAKNGKTFACGLGTAELIGTGYSGDGAQDGATSWLRTTANVAPGETMTLQFMIWNTGDHWIQSAVVLDDFAWDAQGSTAPVTGRPPS